MKEIIKSALISGTAFGLGMALFASPVCIILALVGQPILAVALPFLIFALSGPPFGVAMAIFAECMKNRFLAMNLVPGDETLIHQGGANHFMGVEGVGGWLYLTDQALRFKSHEVNIQRHELTIPLCEIAEVSPCRTIGIIPNGLRITARDGRSERFVVSGRRKWTGTIAKARADAEPASPPSHV